MKAYKCVHEDCGVEFFIKGKGMATYMDEKFCPYCGSSIIDACDHIKKYEDFDFETMPTQTIWTCVKCGIMGRDFGVTQADRHLESLKIKAVKGC